MRRDVVRFARNIVAAVLTRRIASCSLIVPTAGERAELGRPQHLAPVDVADAAHHPLIEQHLAEPGLRIGIREHQIDDLAEVGVGLAEIRTEPTHPRDGGGGPAGGTSRRGGR